MRMNLKAVDVKCIGHGPNPARMRDFVTPQTLGKFSKSPKSPKFGHDRSNMEVSMPDIVACGPMAHTMYCTEVASDTNNFMVPMFKARSLTAAWEVR